MADFDTLGLDVDVDEIFSVNNKTITPPEGTDGYKDVVVVGDNNSNSLFFKINRTLDSVELSDKNFQFYYINPDGYADIINANDVRMNQDYIIFSWKLDSNVTHTAGNVQYIIRITGENYVWKSKPSSIEVVDTLNEEVDPPEYTETWAANIEKRVEVLEAMSGIDPESGIAEEIEAIKGDIRELENSLTTTNRNVSDLQGSITTMQGDIADLSGSLESSVASLNEADAALEGQIEQLKEDIDALTPKIDYSVAFVGVPYEANNYNSINEALQSIKEHQGEYSDFKVVINTGTYREQVVVDVPNVTFLTYTNKKDVKITWYYGVGYTYYSADSTGYYNAENATAKTAKNKVENWGATLTLKNTAENFRAKYITFENSFNRYITDEEIADGVEANTSAYTDTTITLDRTASGVDVTAKTATERAAALASRTTKIEFDECTFLGSQDTIFVGSHSYDSSSKGYFYKCDIQGNTDYIFGWGNVIFEKCDLTFVGYSDVVQSAYITACNNADRGFLFNECTVKQSYALNDSVVSNKNYLGRTWGEGAKVIFNKTVFEDISIMNADFWGEMVGSVENANYIECKSYDDATLIKKADIVNATRLSKYSDTYSYTRSNFFEDWTPQMYEESKELFWDFQCNNDGAYNISLENAEPFEWNGITIDTTNNGKVAPNSGANCTQMNNPANIIIPVLNGDVITVTGYNYTYAANLTLTQNGNSVSGNGTDATFSLTATSNDSAILSATGSTYINSISLVGSTGTPTYDDKDYSEGVVIERAATSEEIDALWD